MKKITQVWMFIALLFSSSLLMAQNEGSGDFPGTGTGPAFNLALGANTFTGDLDTSDDSQDHFQIVLASGQYITSINTSITTTGAQNPNGFFSVNGSTVNFPSGYIPNVPGSPGTYNVIVAANYSAGENWTMTVNVSNIPCTLSASISSQTNASCNGGSDGSITATATDGVANYDYEWSNGSSTINTTSTTNTITGLSAGTYTVTITDNNGCRETASATITQPTAIISSFTSDEQSGCETLSVNFSGNASGGTTPYTNWSWDFGDGNTSTAQNPSHTYTTSGNYTVSLTVTDNNGCSDTETKTNYIQVGSIGTLDAEFTANPTTGCSTLHTVFFTDQSTDPVSWDWDFGDGGTSTAQNPIHTYTSPGTFTTTLTVENSSGCSTSTTGTVRVSSPISATISSQTNASCNGASDGEATVSLTGGTAPYSYSWSPSGGTNATATGLSAGAYTVTVTDDIGCTDSATVTITDTETIPPVANCVPPFTVQLDASGQTAITAADINNGSTDNCSIASISIDVTSFNCSSIGDNSVTLTVTDTSGNVDTCTTTVTVEDNVAPVANCAAPFTVQLDANGQASITVADIENGSTDACGVATTSIDMTDFDCSNVGDNIVTLTVTDVNGNSSTCTTTVTVEDTIAPTIVCAMDTLASTDPGDCFATVSFPNPVALDNCSVDSIVQTAGLPSGSQFPVGVSTVEFTATDASGNTSICTFDITVEDNEAPIAVCENITIQLDEFGSASITAADLDGGSTDACGVDTLAIDQDTFDCSNVGDNNVTLTVTDVNGNTSTCTAVVTVEDVTAPEVVCQDITVQLDATGTVSITGMDVDGGSTDACGIASYDLDMDTFDCSNVGVNTVELTVTDNNGNTATCMAMVTVEDNTSPDLVCTDFTLELGEDGTATLLPDDVIATNDDACGIDTTAVDITQFDCSDIGTPVTVQVFVSDVNGNLSTCNAVVTVVDAMAPVVTCPADQTVDPGEGNLFYEVPDYYALGEASATDNCTSEVTITSQQPAAGELLSDGVYTITLTAEDDNGNIGTCTFELTVESILGIGETDNLGSVQLYPNPANNQVTLGNPSQIQLKEAILYDLTGRVIRTINLNGMGAQKTIDVTNLASTTYIMRISSENGSITKQLIKE